MTKENGAATPKEGNPATVGTSAESYATSRPKNQSNRTVLPDPLGHLIGSPVVVVDEVSGKGAVVCIATLDRSCGLAVLGPPPWGWSGREKTFLCRKSRSAMAWRYVEELQHEIRLKAVDELEFRHRREAARRAERGK